MITDRLRFTVIEINSDQILTRDLVVKEPQVTVRLSAPSSSSFKIDQGQQYTSAMGIEWKNWGQWIIPEIETDNFGRICLGAQIVSDNKIDPQSGDMIIDATGYMGYPKGIPWLENFNPIAVDPAEVIQRVWAHLQSFSNANLGIEVFPALTGTQMLPGFGFDGSILAFDFFAIFIRSVEFVDCGDQITSLARDLPLDLFERVQWNVDRTAVERKIEIAYPLGGLVQENLAFRLGDNVINCEKAEEMEIEPVSDVIIRSWIPGRTYSSTLSNADMTRARRTILEEDAMINGNERAAAWAKRKLQRRNVPKHFSKISIDPNHPHAPFGSWWVGDSIYVEAFNFPWHGDIQEWHRVLSFTIKEGEPLIELELKAEGAFNYDPIEYNPDWDTQPTEDPNRLANGYFGESLAGWTSLQGQWIRVDSVTYDVLSPDSGSVRIDLDDSGEAFRSHRAYCAEGETLHLQCVVKWQEVVSGASDAFQLLAYTSNNADPVGSFVVDEYVNPTGVHGWEMLEADWVVPAGVNEVALQFNVTSGVSEGISWWTYARVISV